MTVLTHQAPTSVLVVNADASVRTAIARLLSLEDSVFVVGTAPSLQQASVVTDVIVDEELLGQFRNLTVGEFIAAIKSRTAPPRAQRHLRPLASGRDMRTALSERELQVVRLLADGLSNKQISIQLELSDKTVKNHISHILAKLNLSARTQVAVHALRAGLV